MAKKDVTPSVKCDEIGPDPPVPQTPTIRAFDAEIDLAQAAADQIVRLATEAIDRRGRFVVALAGGATPRQTYELLADAPYRDAMAWDDIHVCWGDERLVSPSDEQSNYRMAYDTLLKFVDVSADHVHPIPTVKGSAAEGADAYERTLREIFAATGAQVPTFDLILLGMGADGHTASLFPGSPAIDERTRLVVSPWVPSLGVHRITITPPVIEQARAVMVLASGREKAETLRAVLEGPLDPHRLPAQILRGAKGRVTWFVSSMGSGDD